MPPITWKFVGGGLLRGLGFFVKNWKFTLIAGVLLYGWHKYDSMVDTIDDLTKEVGEQKAHVEQLTTALDQQSEAIEKLGELEVKFEKDRELLEEQLAAQRREFRLRLRELEETPAPQTSDEAQQFILDNMEHLKWPTN